MKKRSSLLWLAIAVVILAAATVSFLPGYESDPSGELPQKQASAPPVMRLSPMEVLTIQPKTHVENLRIEGFLLPARRVVLSAKLSGVITNVAVDVGDTVRKDQVVVQFDEGQAQFAVEGRAARARGKEAELARAERELSRARGLAEGGNVAPSKLASTETDKRMLEAERDALRAEEGEARRQLKEAQVVAPFDGAVSLRKVNPGQSVPQNTELLEIVDHSRMLLSAAVPLRDSARLTVGQTAEIRVEGLEEKPFTARLERIAPAAGEASRSLQIFLAVEGNDPVLKGGMFANGALHIASYDDIIALPVAALQEDMGATFVLTIRANKVVRERVEPGRSLDNGKLVEIVRGLVPGDQVIAMPLKGLEPGNMVEVSGKNGTKP